MSFMAHGEDLPEPFWDIKSDRGVQLPLTDLAILEAERLLNVTLPVSLLGLLRKQNGGLVVSSRDAFPTSRPTSWAPDHVPFDQVMGIGHREQALSIVDSPYPVEEWGLPTRSGGDHRQVPAVLRFPEGNG
ncbi:hypothetical protein [Streptomyces sp. NPDC091209]|uniref:hypothetical protein n=1 Tax=Streptomyces sp. NPDC091209 TaxID=3365974 RepID=UPI00380B7102